MAISRDVAVTGLSVSGNPTYDEFMTISANIENVGNWYVGPFEARLYINGVYEEKSLLTGGLLAGQSWTEKFSFKVDTTGLTKATVRLFNNDNDVNSSNDTRSITYTPKQGDMTVTDLRFTGNPTVGEKMTVQADIKNIGTGNYIEYTKVQLFVNDSPVPNATSVLTLGLLSGQSKTENFTYTVERPGENKFEVRIVETNGEPTGNNSRTEYLTIGKTFEDSTYSLAGLGTEIKMASHHVRAVYGDKKIASSYRGEDNDDNGLDDDYIGYFKALGRTVLTDTQLGSHFNGGSLTTRFTTTESFGKGDELGLYEGRETIANFWEAQAILTVGTDEDGEKTLVLAFRGTDNTLQSLDGQAFGVDGMHEYYESLRPLIKAAISYANDNSKGIDKFIVTGHSLGGAMVDVFTAVDGQHVDSDVELHAIAFASAGLDSGLFKVSQNGLNYSQQYDADVVKPTAISAELTAPDWYVGLSHSNDTVTFPSGNFIGTNAPLLSNINFDNRLRAIDLPNMANGDKSGAGFGAEHDDGLYWANMHYLSVDPLLQYHGSHRLIMGITDYKNIPDFATSTVLEVFGDYEKFGTSGYDDDSGTRKLIGGTGKDYILGLSGDDYIVGGADDDLLSGGAGADRIEGNSGNDVVDGGAGDDFVFGDSGDDTFYGGSGNDRIDGGIGTDVVSYVNATRALTADMAAGTVKMGGDTDDLLFIENLTGSVFGDYIAGDEGANRIRSLGGYDWLVGSDGADFFDGGTGRDMISYVNASAGVSVDLGAGRGTGGQAAGDRYVSIERFTGSIYNDLTFGSSGADDFRGLGGYDWFVGSGGGKDRYDGGSGRDTVAYSGSAGGVIASLLAGGGSGGDAALDLYDSIENLTGSSFADHLTGDNDRNVLRGLYGEDTLFGYGGVDYLYGGASDDTMNGGYGFDYAVYSGNRADYDIVRGTAGVFVTDRIGNDGTDTLFEIEAIRFADDTFFL